MDYIQALILAIVEGLTEFLPVSSTGHMIIASSIMGIAHDPFVKLFTVGIQFGAILSVVALYFKRFFQSWQFYLKLFIAFIPAAIFGLAFSDYIDMLLEDVVVVAVMLLLGGILFLYIDKIFKNSLAQPDKEMKYQQGFIIGLFQVIAMIPGVSRSAATIIGGLSQKFNKKQAAEFSFFLAVPTMAAATVKTMYDHYKAGTLEINSHTVSIFAFGNIVAFIVAALAIRSFISYLTKHGFKAFGWYRIIVGLTILILYFAGVKLQIV
ncbi:MAG TPA: undecaprenyl-diphosphate phosphatase [Bacteroidia bacterium]|nr:undecaprenyl-diphosphate phosphatase [Bacteroidia bacterium]